MSLTRTSAPSDVAVRRLPRPRPSRLLTTDLLAVGGFVVLVTLGLWWQHDGLTGLAGGGIGALSAIGQLTGLLAALAAHGGLVLTSRPRWLERRYGQDQLVAAHRWFGIVTVTATSWSPPIGGSASSR